MNEERTIRELGTQFAKAALGGKAYLPQFLKALDSLATKLREAEERSEDLQIAFEKELECCQQRGTQLQTAREALELIAAEHPASTGVMRDYKKIARQALGDTDED